MVRIYKTSELNTGTFDFRLLTPDSEPNYGLAMPAIPIVHKPNHDKTREARARIYARQYHKTGEINYLPERKDYDNR